MIKFLINIATILLCCFIIFMGATKTINNSKPVICVMLADFQTVLQEQPVIPDSGNSGDDSGEGTPGGDSSEGGDVGGGSGSTTPEQPSNPETPETPSNSTADTIKGMIDNYNEVIANTTQNMISNSITNIIPDDNENKEVISEAVDTYFDKLYSAIENKKNETDGMDDADAAEQAKTEFAEKESAALNGLMTIVGAASSGETKDEELTESVDAILESDVCLETITETITEDPKMQEDVKNATSSMTEETKTSIEDAIQQKLQENPEKEEQYQKLADLLGIQLKGSN